MAFDENLAGRMRTALSERGDVEEKRMFGGLAFMIGGAMRCGIIGSDLMIRVDKQRYDEILKRAHVRPMDFTGKPMRGMVYVSQPAFKTASALSSWIELALDAPAAKSSKKSAPTKGFVEFPPETFRFLAGLAANNNKTWFDAHRDEYERGYVEPAKAFVEAIGPRLKKISSTVQFEAKINGSIFRINRDVRFSKDKSPYKPHLDLWFWEGEKRGWDTPGFFFRMFSDRLTVGAGMHQLQKDQLTTFRDAVVDAKKGAALVKVLDAVRAKGPYTIGGASRKSVPRGYDADHPRAELLLHEGLWAEIEGPVPTDIVDSCARHFTAMAPVSKWLRGLLTEG